MEITVAKSAGFCFGVQRAVDSVYKELEENSGKIYTFGPIIHNEQVVEDLNKRGIEVIDTVEQLKKIKEGTVVIRSHGVAKEIYDILEQQKLKMVDATCPFVKKIHNIVLDEIFWASTCLTCVALQIVFTTVISYPFFLIISTKYLNLLWLNVVWDTIHALVCSGKLSFSICSSLFITITSPFTHPFIPSTSG